MQLQGQLTLTIQRLLNSRQLCAAPLKGNNAQGGQDGGSIIAGALRELRQRTLEMVLVACMHPAQLEDINAAFFGFGTRA